MILLLLSFWIVLFVIHPVHAGFITQPNQRETSEPKGLSAKFHSKINRMIGMVEVTVKHLGEQENFIGKILKKHKEINNRWLIPALAFLLISAIFCIGTFAPNPFLGSYAWLTIIAVLTFLVFLVLWLLTFLEVIE